jgi:predicted AlkP superfamily pyrophosphatase or phosphodiesterase
MLPDYGGACLSSVVPHLLDRRLGPCPSWMPSLAHQAEQIVLLVVDGLGWEQLRHRLHLAPSLSAGSGGPITSVAPSTTATALTSLATGLVPAVHGILGYRLRFGDDVVNILRWQSDRGDMRMALPVPTVQPRAAFAGSDVPAVSRADFAATGFTAAHLGGSRLVGWSVPSTLIVEVRRLLGDGCPFVYAYYDGIDKVAHQYGQGEHYDQELRFVDRLVGDLVSVLPPGAALVVTADHGHVDVGDAVRMPSGDLLAGVELLSGEGRFRWLHARPGAAGDVEAVARSEHGDEAWVLSREQMIDDGWYGGALSPALADRIGDVALVARAPVAFLDPADTGETNLASRHGSLTEAEMLVPLLALPAP